MPIPPDDKGATTTTSDEATKVPQMTYAMKKGSNHVFATNNPAVRSALYRRGWQRIGKAAAARAFGSSNLLASAVAQCTGGEMERISELGEVRVICHGHASAQKAVANSATPDERSAAAERLLLSHALTL